MIDAGGFDGDLAVMAGTEWFTEDRDEDVFNEIAVVLEQHV